VRWLYRVSRGTAYVGWVARRWKVGSAIMSLVDKLIFSIRLLHNKTFRDIAISLLATYGLYFFGSLIHFEPWHLVTSFVQYLFFLPSCKSLLRISNALTHFRPRREHS